LRAARRTACVPALLLLADADLLLRADADFPARAAGVCTLAGACATLPAFAALRLPGCDGSRADASSTGQAAAINAAQKTSDTPKREKRIHRGQDIGAHSRQANVHMESRW